MDFMGFLLQLYVYKLWIIAGLLIVAVLWVIVRRHGARDKVDPREPVTDDKTLRA